jgi:hypothetical protein
MLNFCMAPPNAVGGVERQRCCPDSPWKMDAFDLFGEISQIFNGGYS